MEKVDRGVLYVAADDEYIQETIRSARSVNQHLPEVNIGICTNSNDPDDVFDTVIDLNDPAYSFGDKVKAIPKSPYNKTVYLDSDTHVIDEGGILNLFQLLDRFDFAARPFSPVPARASQNLEKDISNRIYNRMEKEVPVSFPRFNSGVIAFNNTKPVREMFDMWEYLYNEHDKVNPGVGTAPDQPSLREAIYHSDLNVAPLSFEYNYHILLPQPVRDKVRILHQGEVENYEEIAEKVNKNPSSKRFFHALERGGKCYLWRQERSSRVYQYHVFRHSLQERGINKTLMSTLIWLFGGDFWNYESVNRI